MCTFSSNSLIYIKMALRLTENWVEISPMTLPFWTMAKNIHCWRWGVTEGYPLGQCNSQQTPNGFTLKNLFHRSYFPNGVGGDTNQTRKMESANPFFPSTAQKQSQQESYALVTRWRWSIYAGVLALHFPRLSFYMANIQVRQVAKLQRFSLML